MENKKKILIISRSFYPTLAPRALRTTELAKEFARQGHEVTVLTPKLNEHVDFERKYELTIKDLGNPYFKDINIKNKNKAASLFYRFIRRGLIQLFEYPDIGLIFQVSRKLKKESGYDLLISIAVPHPVHWGVARIWGRNGEIAKTWVADCGDPYMMASGDSFRKLPYFRYFEKSFCRKCDYITVPVNEAKSAYYPEFHQKVKVIPQGFQFPDIKKVTKKEKNKVITFAYSGTIIPYKKYAISFFNLLNSYHKPFKFVVYTKNKDFYQKYLTQETLDKCVINDYVDREELIQKLAEMDFFISFPYEVNSQKPLKLIDYQYTGKPVLVFRDDETSHRTFNEFMAFDFSNKMENENFEQYHIENVCKQFLDLVP